MWAKKSSEKGLDSAEFAVGYMFENGIGTEADLESARKFYMRSCAQGYQRALNRINEISEAGYDDEDYQPTLGQPSDWRNDRANRNGQCSVM